MTCSQDNSLNRRVAFWNCSMHKFHDFVFALDKDFTGKWIEPLDEAAMATVLKQLQDLEITITERYRDVLSDQLLAMRKSQEARNE